MRYFLGSLCKGSEIRLCQMQCKATGCSGHKALPVGLYTAGAQRLARSCVGVPQLAYNHSAETEAISSDWLLMYNESEDSCRTTELQFLALQNFNELAEGRLRSLQEHCSISSYLLTLTVKFHKTTEGTCHSKQLTSNMSRLKLSCTLSNGLLATTKP